MKNLLLVGVLLLMGVSPLRAQESETCISQREQVSLAQPQTQYDYLDPQNFEAPLLNYLNQGGAAGQIEIKLESAFPKSQRVSHIHVIETDVTGDASPDVVIDALIFFASTAFEGVTFVYHCQNGLYQGGIVATYRGWTNSSDEIGNNLLESGLLDIREMNGNDTPELLISGTKSHDIEGRFYRYYQIYEWNGDAFANLIPFEASSAGFSMTQATNYAGESEAIDLDDDGTLELVLTDKIKYWSDSLTSVSVLNRYDKHIWSWNGEQFELTCTLSAEAPEYLVQAIEDGGLFMACGDYESALASYQRALDDPTLMIWTESMNRCPGCPGASGELANVYEQLLATPETETAAATFHTRSELIIYVRYRLMLIYALQGSEAEVEAQYQQAQRDFTANSADYVRLAKVFWESYQRGDTLALACEQVESYAAEYGITSPLTQFSFQGVDSGVDEDLCPL
jgi:tetratricopeptide (TPR) repeat protein